MVSREIEYWNALTMVPGIFYAFQHLNRLDYTTFGFLCASSVHLHLGRALQWSAEKDAMAYHLDRMSQMVCILANASGLFEVFLAGFGVFFHLFPRLNIHIQYLYQATLMTFISYHRPEALRWFMKSFFWFILSKLPIQNGSVFHGMFHWATLKGMLAFWSYSSILPDSVPVPAPVPALAPYPIPEMVSGALLILWSYCITRIHGPPLLHLDRVLGSFILGGMAVASYITQRNQPLFHTMPFLEWNPITRIQVYAEWTHYIAEVPIHLYHREYEMVYHHILSLIGTGAAAYYGFQSLFGWALVVLIPTNMFLQGSKWARAAKKETLARGIFTVFATLFAILRLGGFSIFYYQTLQRSHSVEVIGTYGYIGFNGVIGLLYILQWVWFYKIVGILYNARKKVLKEE
jgi:TLC domain